MKIIDCVQGSQQWLDLRVGVLTASKMDRILTPKTRKPSTQATKLAYEMLAEQVLGRSLNDASSGFMERGSEMEAEARAWYEFERDVDVVQVGLVLRDDERVGCSPDGLVGEDGGVEIKCPSAAVHMGYLLDGPGDDYYCQVQGSLWVTGRKWWDLVSYTPGFPTVCLRFQRDEEFIGALSAATETFLSNLDEYRARLRAMGLLQERTLTLSEALAQARAA